MTKNVEVKIKSVVRVKEAHKSWGKLKKLLLYTIQEKAIVRKIFSFQIIECAHRVLLFKKIAVTVSNWPRLVMYWFSYLISFDKGRTSDGPEWLTR